MVWSSDSALKPARLNGPEERRRQRRDDAWKGLRRGKERRLEPFSTIIRFKTHPVSDTVGHGVILSFPRQDRYAILISGGIKVNRKSLTATC